VRRLSRSHVFALATLAGALGTCTVLPVFDPTCAMSSNSSASLGACAAQVGFARQVALVGLVIAAIGVAIFLASIGVHAAVHHRISGRLRRHARPAVVAGHAVELVPGIEAAFVAGIRYPRIFCADDLATHVDADELRAVILHEHYHELSHAPARLILLSAVAPLVERFGPGSAWLEGERARIEIAADEHAISNGATRATLARAILKLADPSSRLSLAGFATASDLRLRALLGEEIGSTTHPLGAAAMAVGAAAVVVLLCSVFSLV
jgi:beta-lactamase regulating signal transducer with metallopeptidase domain